MSGFRLLSRRSPDGAIAQLGERLLCKQEVVGSIPSGSTNFVICATALRAPWAHVGCAPRFALRGRMLDALPLRCFRASDRCSCQKSRICAGGLPPRAYLLHREEGIDLGLPCSRKNHRSCTGSRHLGSAAFKPPAVGSISMKFGLIRRRLFLCATALRAT